MFTTFVEWTGGYDDQDNLEIIEIVTLDGVTFNGFPIFQEDFNSSGLFAG